MNLRSDFEPLYTADPDFAAGFCRRLSENTAALLAECREMVMADIIWALAQEASFGSAVADGYIALAENEMTRHVAVFHDWIGRFGQKGPQLGKIMAEHLVPVLAMDDPDVVAGFEKVIAVMLEKGAYTLYNPLIALDGICETGDKKAVAAYFDLLIQTFSLEMTYKQCRPFTYTLPKAVASFSPEKRAFQTEQLSRVIQKDFTLSDYMLEGLSGGLHLLSGPALALFVSKALEKYEESQKRCAKFLSLGSKMGMDTFLELQVAVSFSQVGGALARYVAARTGFPVAVMSQKRLPGGLIPEHSTPPTVCSDGRTIFVPEEINCHEDRDKNLALYKALVKLEAGLFEFHSFDFDFEKLVEKADGYFLPALLSDPYVSDFELFLNHFEPAELALALFTIFEHGRIMALTRQHYPGLVRNLLPMLKAAQQSSASLETAESMLSTLYRVLVLDGKLAKTDNAVLKPVVKQVAQRFSEKMAADPVVETSAVLVALSFPDILAFYEPRKMPLTLNFSPPFGRKFYPGLFVHANQAMDHKAQLLKNRLAKLGVAVYRSEIRRKLVQTSGPLSPAALKELVVRSRKPGDGGDRDAAVSVAVSQIDWSKIMSQTGIDQAAAPEITGRAFYYREWDNRLADYLQQHTLVHEREIMGADGPFYEETLNRFSGLVKQIRYAFELLRPEGISILRQWIEGDEFDYRALLDFALDRKAGIMPSDRLYIKKIKQQRDVAVLLLVDLSRSTANVVPGGAETVLDVEKQAIVLFCEALEVVGDQYAVAGFSGTGRLGVDYFVIKDFEDTLGNDVFKNINAMHPQRSTRMGAAIRHATARLEKNKSAVRLMILIGDGFPNDVDYKKDYAIADTRKAILEARSKKIYTHALTVNLPGDPNLDELYGPVHHHVISDVRELPRKLPRIYSALTKY